MISTLPDGFSIQEPDSPFKVFVHLEILFGRSVSGEQTPETAVILKTIE